MAIDLTTIFGTEIMVEPQPALADRQYSGFPGAFGLTCMHLGTRGRPLTIRGTLAVFGADYATARAGLQAAIDAIEPILWCGVADYSHFGIVYYYVVFDSFHLLIDAGGKTVHWTSEGYATCRFICTGRSLI